MKVVRTNVFETNSSSCHSICICSREDYESKDSFVYKDYEDVYNKESLKDEIVKCYTSPYYKDEYKDIEEQYNNIWDAYKEFESDLELVKTEFNVDNEYDCNSSFYRDCIPDTISELEDKIENFKEYAKEHNLFKKYYALQDKYKEVCSNFYENIISIDDWLEDMSYDFETYEESYTSKSGDEIVAFGYYGHD